jgi:hypothetical protein
LFEATEKSVEKKYATEKSVKCSEKVPREKDAMGKSVKCYGKVRIENKILGKTCEKTRKYPNQNFPSNYKEKKVLLGEQIFPRNY